MLPAYFSLESFELVLYQCSVNKSPTGTPSAVCCLMEIERFRLNYHVDKIGIKNGALTKRKLGVHSDMAHDTLFYGSVWYSPG